MLRPRPTRFLVFAASAVVTCMFLVNLCNAIYRCGCRSWWAGAAAHCNIHTAGARHCPWCTLGTLRFALVLAAILGPQLLLSLYPRRWPWPLRLLLALLAFPVVGVLAGLLTGWLAGYWTT